MRKILLCLLLVTGSVSAQVKTGNDLLADIQSGNVTVKMTANYYMLGVSDGLELERSLEGLKVFNDPKIKYFSRPYMCFPNGVTNKQTYDVIEQYLVKNPATRNFSAASLIRTALVETWPCAGNPP